MPLIGALLVFVFCIPVFFFPARLVRRAIYFAIFALLLGAIGFFWPAVMPENFLTENPWAVDSPLHPQVAGYTGGVCLLFGLGILLALGARALYVHFRLLKPR